MYDQLEVDRLLSVDLQTSAHTRKLFILYIFIH
jgi:hypothetical protein